MIMEIMNMPEVFLKKMVTVMMMMGLLMIIKIMNTSEILLQKMMIMVMVLMKITPFLSFLEPMKLLEVIL